MIFQCLSALLWDLMFGLFVKSQPALVFIDHVLISIYNSKRTIISFERSFTQENYCDIY